MKKKHLILSAILAFVSLGAVAAPVTKERAVATARAFMKTRGFDATQVSNVYTPQGNSLYVVNFNPIGFVVVSGDDMAAPIVGYSMDSTLPWNSIPGNMQAMLNTYSAQVKVAAVNGKMVNREWDNMISLRTRSDESAAIAPIIRVNWNQTAPYNKYCPGSGSNKAIVGCVAVAMSQAMSVQKYPPRPTGLVNYTPAGYSNINLNYDAEKPYNWDNILSGANQYDEAARLMYHAGVSVQMMYGAQASAVSYNKLYLIRDALVNNFSYGNDVTIYYRKQYENTYGRTAWIRLMINELSSGRAVVYNGTGSAGHSFNVDGYDGVSMFHLNWGWQGIGNGYFSLDNLYDEYQGIAFPDNHVAIIGIGSPDRELRSVEINATGIEEGLAAGTVVANITVNGTEPKPSYQFRVRGPYINGAYRDVPFEIKGTKLVTTKQLSVAEKASYDFDIIVSTSGETPLTMSFTINVEPWKALAAGTMVTYDRASGIFSFKTQHNVSYTLRSAAGATLASGTLNEFPGFEINKASLAAGVNTLTLTRGSETKTITLIK